MMVSKAKLLICKSLDWTEILILEKSLDPHEIHSENNSGLPKIRVWVEWSSGFRRYIQDWKEPGSNPTRCATRLCDPT